MTAQVAEPQQPGISVLGTYSTKCSNCGAPLEITPDAVGYVCEYCGWTGVVDGIGKKRYSCVKALSREQNRTGALGFLRDNLRKGFSDSQIREEKFYAIPFWVTEVAARSEINGYQTKAKTESYTVTVPGPKGQMHTETRTRVYYVYVPVRGVLSDNFVFVLCARKNASFYGLDEIRNRVRAGSVQPLDPVPLLKEKMEFLDVELDEEEDREWSETGAEEEHYRKAKSQTTELFDCRTQTQVGEPRLVYYPIYQLDYEVRGKVFRATFDGASAKVVKAELPLPGYLRTMYVAGAYGLIALGTMIALARAQPVIMGIGALVASLSGVLIHFATRTQKTKRG